MSGLVMIQGQLAGAMTRLQSAQVVSAGRGEITEQFSDGMFHWIYQGLSPGSEFFRDSDWVCCVLGWPYEMRSNIAVALNAEMIAFRFAQQQILDRNCLFGQYLIVIYSRRNQTLWVLRDTLGGLPLHWSANSNFGVHASDIRQIYAVLGSDPILQLAALKDYHQNLTLRNETALYHDAFQHLPGEFSICDGKN